MIKTKIYVVLQGLNQNYFLDCCNKNGIVIRNYLRHSKSKSSFILLASDYEAIKKQGIFSYYKVNSKIVGGIKYYLLKIPQKIGLFAGVFVSAMSIFLASQRVLKITIIAPNNTLVTAIQNYLAENGYGVGCEWKEISTTALETELFANIKDSNDVTVKKIGSTLSVLTSEATKTKKRESQIIAPEDCTIEYIEVAKGKAMFKKGDIVKRGEVIVDLLDGELVANVQVRIYHQSSVSISQFSQKTARTGESVKKTKLVWPWQNIDYDFNCSYEKYEKETTITPISSVILPIKRVTVTYYKLQIGTETEDNATEKAKQKAQFLATKEFNKTDRITFEIRQQNGQKFVDCFAESVILL